MHVDTARRSGGVEAEQSAYREYEDAEALANRAVQTVSDRHEKAIALRKEADKAAAERDRVVADAIDAQYGLTVLAKVMGVSKSRVHPMAQRGQHSRSTACSSN